MKTLKSIIAIFSFVILFVGASTLLDTKDAGACPTYWNCFDQNLYDDLCDSGAMCHYSALQFWRTNCAYEWPCEVY